MTDFPHSAVLSMADTVIEAVKTGAVRHFFLWADATVQGQAGTIIPNLYGKLLLTRGSDAGLRQVPFQRP